MRSFRARGLAGIQDLLRNVPRQRNRLQRGVAAILREYVTAEFPGGYTVLEATGYWKPDEAPSTMREDSRIIAILAPADAGEKVRRIARLYRQLFLQESVLVTISPADAEFVDAISDEKQP